MNKKGQFYLAAAIIIVAIIVGFSAVVNHFEKEEVPDLEEVRQELLIEMQKIQDAGIEGDLDDEEINNNLEIFTEIYSESMPVDTDFYFVFGNTSDVTVAGYQESDEEDIIIKDDKDKIDGTALTIPRGIYVSSAHHQPFTENTIKKVKVKVDDEEHDFEIKPGRNFHFVIYYEEKGEKHIIRK